MGRISVSRSREAAVIYLGLQSAAASRGLPANMGRALDRGATGRDRGAIAAQRGGAA